MSQKEHEKREADLQFCKDRALKILEDGGTPTQAWTSFLSDMQKEESTKNHSALTLGMMLFAGEHLSTHYAMKKHIEDYA